MISPPYTPFTEHEVCSVLELARSAYSEAVRTGALTRSVHFDCRVSSTTALHSLVDVVRYDSIFRNAATRTHAPGFAEQCDWWLDELCGAHDDCAGFWKIAMTGDVKQVMNVILPESTARARYGTPSIWHEELFVMSHVIASWGRCYRALHKMLVADEIRCGIQEFVNQPMDAAASKRSFAANTIRRVMTGQP